MVHTIQFIAMLEAGQMQILSLIWISQCINGGICGFPNEIYMDFLMVKYMDFSMEYLDFLLAADVFRG